MLRRLAAVVCLSACAPLGAGSCPSGVLVLTLDPASSTAVGVLPLDGTAPELYPAPYGATDAVLATSQGRRFLVERSPLDLLFELDTCGHGTSQLSARAPGETATTNPQDVAVAPDGSLWIARLGVPSLLVLSEGAAPETIDLSSFDSDGNPDMSSVRILGSRAFVALDRLNPYPKSVEPSELAVLDTTTRAIVSTLTLAGRDPFGQMTEAPSGALWLAEPGNLFDATESDAGIERVDPVGMTTSLVMSEATLGASVVELAISATCGAAIVVDPSTENRTSLVSFSLDGSNEKTALGPTGGFDLRGLAWSGSELLLGDARPSGAGFPVHVFSAASDCTLTPGRDLSVPALPAIAFAP